MHIRRFFKFKSHMMVDAVSKGRWIHVQLFSSCWTLLPNTINSNLAKEQKTFCKRNRIQNKIENKTQYEYLSIWSKGPPGFPFNTTSIYMYLLLLKCRLRNICTIRMYFYHSKNNIMIVPVYSAYSVKPVQMERATNNEHGHAHGWSYTYHKLKCTCIEHLLIYFFIFIFNYNFMQQICFFSPSKKKTVQHFNPVSVRRKGDSIQAKLEQDIKLFTSIKRFSWAA